MCVVDESAHWTVPDDEAGQKPSGCASSALGERARGNFRGKRREKVSGIS